MGKTAIQWSDETWNPTRGCSRISPGCMNCYAERVAGRFSGSGQPYHGFASGPSTNYHGGTGAPRSGVKLGWTGHVALIPEKLVDPLSWRKPKRVFVDSMSDLFHEKLTNDEIAAVFGVMAACPHVIFQVLTKRAARMSEWFEWVARDLEDRWKFPAIVGHAAAFVKRLNGGIDTPASDRLHRVAIERAGVHGWPLPNVWLGVSVEDQRRAEERIPELIETPAAVRFLSVEPLLERVTLYQHLMNRLGPTWVIVGGESGIGARVCSLSWIREVVRDCARAKVPCFVKQLGARPFGEWGDDNAPTRHVTDLTGGERRDYVEESRRKNGVWVLGNKKGGSMSEWPADLRVREFPREATLDRVR